MTLKPSPAGEGGVRRNKIILFFKMLLIEQRGKRNMTHDFYYPLTQTLSLWRGLKSWCFYPSTQVLWSTRLVLLKINKTLRSY